MLDENVRSGRSDWRAVVEKSGSAVEVLRLCKLFIAGWSPQRLAALPEECRPPAQLATPQEVADYAVLLAQTHCKQESASPELHAMAAFFTSAAARLSQLLATHTSDRVPLFVRGFL